MEYLGHMKIGSTVQRNPQICDFCVWAPLRHQVALQLTDAAGNRLIPMQRDEQGYWQAQVAEVAAGTRYWYQLDGDLVRPDPASHYQPDDVHGASCVVDHEAFNWQDQSWVNLPLSELVVYELHVGTFTQAGTFAAVIPRLPALQDLGINAIEIMPVAQFPGDRNWGYDGVYPFAVQHSYGGPAGLKLLVNACHQHGIAVILDVVYNHLGPEGNYTGNFGPYVTHRYHTPWGDAMNFDGAYCQGVRNFFIENALYWLRDYHLDGLRLDAIHAIYDFGAKHFLAELDDAVNALSSQQGKPYYLIAESDLNDRRVLLPQSRGGYGMDTQWSDDFHHALHTLLTGETTGYYQDFGRCDQLAKAIQEGFVYAWDYSVDRQRQHGSYGGDLPPAQFVIFSQNHDQVGNRMLGDRLTQSLSFSALKLAAAATLLSPNLPMLFMGEEYGEVAPFLYFISHHDPQLIEAVRQGRKREFAAFHAQGEPPDAFSREAFNQSKLNWELRNQGHHGVLLKFYQRLIQLRRQIPALRQLTRQGLQVQSWETERVIAVLRQYQHDTDPANIAQMIGEQPSAATSAAYLVMNFNSQPVTLEVVPPQGTWHKVLDSEDCEWQGEGSLAPEELNVTNSTLRLRPHMGVLFSSPIPNLSTGSAGQAKES